MAKKLDRTWQTQFHERPVVVHLRAGLKVVASVCEEVAEKWGGQKEGQRELEDRKKDLRETHALSSSTTAVPAEPVKPEM